MRVITIAAAFALLACAALPSSVSAQDNCNWDGFDLSSIAGSPYSGADSSYKYTVQVCGTIAESQCAAKNGAFCQYSTATPPVYQHMISQWDGSGVWSDCPASTCPNGGVQVHFANGDACSATGGNPRDTTFIFQCPAAGAASSTAYTVVAKTCSYTVTMVNEVGCPGSGGGGGGKGGLSGGSIFLIILVVVVPVYIVAGCVWKRQRQGTSGMESCPNIDFWRDLPSLVGDGFKFTWRKCLGLCGKGGDNYEGMK